MKIIASILICLVLVSHISTAQALDFTATAYCPCEVCCGKWARNRPNGIVYTASGMRAIEGKTVAVDRKLIPLKTVLRIRDIFYIAQDVGGAIKGNRLDIYFELHSDAWKFGVQCVTVEIMKVPLQRAVRR